MTVAFCSCGETYDADEHEGPLCETCTDDLDVALYAGMLEDSDDPDPDEPDDDEDDK